MSANVLIVDDSATMRGVIRRMLDISGLNVGDVFEATNGIEALAQMDAHSVHLVLLDINMPIMSGLKLAERMRDDPRLRDIPVVIASTEGSQTRIRELLAGGVRAFLRKPFRPEQLRDVLAPLVGLRPQPADTPGDESSF